MSITYFAVDGGATYLLSTDDEGRLVARGRNTGTTYTSAATRLTVTGVVRSHPRVGTGARGVLTLDTGEGLSVLRGVALGADPQPMPGVR